MTQTLAPFSAALADLVETAGRSVVSLGSGRWRSSGFAWKPGFVVAADEALGDEDAVDVTLPGGASAKAEVAGRDPSTDVALLRLADAELPLPDFGAGPPRAGALAAVVGARDGSPVAALGALGHVGPAWSSVRGGRIDARIELDLHMPRAAEGGLAVDAEGRALGMAVRGPRGRTLVVPSATIERAAGLLETHGRIPRGYLGVALELVRVGTESARRALMVMRVDPDSPAAKAGVLQGDIILGVAGREQDGPRGLYRALGPESVGQTIGLLLQRAGAPLEIAVTVVERPAA